MNKENKVLIILFIAVLFDMITTYTFMNGDFINLSESNPIINTLYHWMHPMLVTVVYPIFIVSLWGLFMKIFNKLKLETESRTLVLFTAVMFVVSGLRNIGYMILEMF